MQSEQKAETPESSDDSASSTQEIQQKEFPFFESKEPTDEVKQARIDRITQLEKLLVQDGLSVDKVSDTELVATDADGISTQYGGTKFESEGMKKYLMELQPERLKWCRPKALTVRCSETFQRTKPFLISTQKQRTDSSSI